MYAKFFSPPDGSGSWQSRFVYTSDKIISYEYTKRWTSFGSAALVFVHDDDLLKTIGLNYFVLYGGEMLVIEGIRYDHQTITLTCYDCKRLLSYRISTFGSSTIAGTEGYDVVSGTTSECVKHYLDRNIITPTDNERAISMRYTADTAGLEQDSYMARLEPLSDIVQTLCDGAGVGYEVIPDGTGFCYVLKSTVDKTINQSIRPRVIFAPAWGNVISMEFEHDEQNLINAIYATGADVTQTVYRTDTVPQGIARREGTVDVTVDTVADIPRYALAAAEDNVDTHTYTIGAGVKDYGTVYTVGDIVTVQDPWLGNYYSAVITAATYTARQGNISVEITLGKQQPKLLDRIVNNMLNGVMRGKKK